MLRRSALGQKRHRLRHRVRQDARALAAADHDEAHGVVARHDVARALALQHRRAHRVAGVDALHARGQRGGPCAAGDRVHAGGEDLVDAPQHAVLFVDHAGDAQKRRAGKRRDGRIAAEARHHRGPVPDHPRQRRRHAARDHEGRRRLRRRAAARGRRAAHLIHLHHMGKPARIARAPRVGRQLHPPAAPHHRLGQRLRGEHVPPRPARRDDKKRRGHQRRRRIRMSPISPCARVRVKASSIPTMIPMAMSEDPP
jgi:hypothetical protein